MNNKQRAAEAIKRLEERYPDAACSLTYAKPHELLIATRLSAQCTDARVNIVTPALFAKYPTIKDLAEADVTDVEALVRTCGFYHTKAQDIVQMCGMLITDYGSVVPDNMDDLLRLPGVGRKTANLVLGDIYGKPAIVCDTHCIRITNLLGLTTVKEPAKVEQQLSKLLPKDKSNDFCHRLVLFGREICIARRPQCGVCPLSDICKSGNTAQPSKSQRYIR